VQPRYVSPCIIQNEKGNIVFSALAAMVLIGVILQTGGMDRLAQSNQTFSSSRLKASRDVIAYQVERYATLPSSFRNSLLVSGNQALQNCVLGATPNACKGDGTEYPLHLYTPAVVGSTAFKIGGPEIASENDPVVLYDVKGNLCQTGAKAASSACPFQVVTTFTAQCPGAAPSCSVAETISVHYKVGTPEHLKIILASVDKSASCLPTRSILPPAFGYVGNSITVSTFVTAGVETIAMEPTAVTTYQEVLTIVQQAIGTGGNPNLAKEIAKALFDYNHIKDPAIIGALAKVWVKNAPAAWGMAGTLDWIMLDPVENGPVPTAETIAEVEKAVGNIANPFAVEQVASQFITEVPLAEAMAAALVGITDDNSGAAIASAHITDAAIAKAVEAAVVATGIEDAAYNLAEYAQAKKISDIGVLTAKANQLAINETREVKTTTTTTASTVTRTTVTSPVPVSMTRACSSSTDCGTTIGM
jgi:hypothetical protein